MDVARLEEQARPLLASEAAYHYFVGGADDEVTVRENEAAWRGVRFLPHVLRDVTTVDTGTTVAGEALSVPILIAPMAAQRLAHPEGEAAMARAAQAAGTIMVVSTMATTSLEDVAAATSAPLWFQFYVHRDREMSADLILRAKAAGYRAVVLTVDLPLVGRRRRDEIHGFALPDGMQMENIRVALERTHGSALAEYSDAAFDPSLTPDDIGWIRSIVDLPVWIKGVLRGDDAVAAVDAGAAGIIVSNHGGRQLDGAIATAHAVPAIVDALGGRVPVMVDGGIRGGYDVVKALALGANAVLLGRPLLWGLAVGGEDGASGVLREFTDEMARTMALCGVTSVGAIDADLLVR